MAEIAGGAMSVPVWANELGGITFELRGNGPHRFVKWSPAGSPVDLGDEATRLDWAINYLRVPRVIDLGADSDGQWLVTEALPGENAVTDRWRARPDVAVAAIGTSLRALHDVLPPAACPFSWSAPLRVERVRAAAARGLADPATWDAGFEHLSLDEALAQLAAVPDTDAVVVCHGDACAPNTLIDDLGRCSGHVDMGSLGVGDRWADIAIATLSTNWNYGPGWEPLLLDAYGVDPDPERTAYYRLLWSIPTGKYGC